jgi:hypothetical protein
MADDNGPSDFELALNILESDFAGNAPASGGSAKKKDDKEMIKDTTTPPDGAATSKV